MGQERLDGATSAPQRPHCSTAGGDGQSDESLAISVSLTTSRDSFRDLSTARAGPGAGIRREAAACPEIPAQE
jgi:hypothetical protein